MTAEISPPAADFSIPFQVEGAEARGRLVRLGPLVDQILSAHNYPDPVARVLGDLLALTALMGSQLKFNGTLTIQARGTGALTLLVADYEHDASDETTGHLRGYAQFDPDILGLLGKAPSFMGMMKQGYLVITIDPNDDKMNRYQGVVPVEGLTVADAARAYFRDSEQIPTVLDLSTVKVMGADAGWRAGGIIVQHLAAPGSQAMVDEEENWTRIEALASTITADEVTDPALPGNELLFRLFHEDGVRVFDPKPLDVGCRCSRERISGILKGMSQDDIDHSIVDDQISVNCEFCNQAFVFTAEEISQLRAG